MNLNKVIATTHFRRPYMTQQFFESLLKCYGIEDYELLIAIDYSIPHARACNQVIELCNKFALTSTCKNVEIFVNKPLLGVDKSKLFILPKAFQKSDYVVFLEDDTGLSPTTLRYFEWFAREYGNSETIASASGYNRVLDVPIDKLDPYGYTIQDGFSPWGWAMSKTWYERLYGLDGTKYADAVGGEVNGKFDHYAHTYGIKYARPTLSLTNHATPFDACHTESEEYWREHEEVKIGAWLLDLPDDKNMEWHLEGDKK